MRHLESRSCQILPFGLSSVAFYGPYLLIFVLARKQGTTTAHVSWVDELMGNFFARWGVESIVTWYSPKNQPSYEREVWEV